MAVSSTLDVACAVNNTLLIIKSLPYQCSLTFEKEYSINIPLSGDVKTFVEIKGFLNRL